MSELYFLTGNANKFTEAQLVFPTLKQIDIDLPELQHTDPNAVLEFKIAAAQNKISDNYFVEDISLRFEALNTLPGPLVKWFLRDLGLQGLAELAFKYPHQRAVAICSIACKALGELYFVKSEIAGEIVFPRGTNGFGWDAIFKPVGSNSTFAEMSVEEKQGYSMRNKALSELKKVLNL